MVLLKGLYGLCVAFCEAQDITDESAITTEEELALLEAGAPSGRILANYNGKKQEDDPPMPCILPGEQCPCWSDAEIQSIDGYRPNGESIDLQCGETRDSETGALTFSRTREGIQGKPGEQVVLAWDEPEGDPRLLRACFYRNLQDGNGFARFLSIEAETLSESQLVSCLAQPAARCNALGL